MKMRAKKILLAAVSVLLVFLWFFPSKRFYAYWLISRAEEKLADSDFKENVLFLSKAANIDETNPRVWWRLCEGYQLTDEFDLAVAACQRNIELHKNEGDSYNSLGLAYMAKKDQAKAAEAFEVAVAKSPQDVHLWGNYVWALQSSSQYEKTITATQKLAELNANDTSGRITALESLAATYTKLGQKDKTKQILAEVHKIDPTVNFNTCDLTQDKDGNTGVTCTWP